MVTVNDYTATVGRRVKAYRDVSGLNQSELAGLAGISQPTVSRIEKGNGQLDGGAVVQLAAALRVSVGALLGSMLIDEKVIAAGRPGNDISTMRTMRTAARDYLADFRRLSAG